MDVGGGGGVGWHLGGACGASLERAGGELNVSHLRQGIRKDSTRRKMDTI